MTKMMTTHLTISGLGTVHAALSRLETMHLLQYAYDSDAVGVDVPIVVRKAPTDPYQQTTIWVGMALLTKAMISEQHEVEVSETPFSPLSEEDRLDPTSATITAGDGLVVEL